MMMRVTITTMSALWVMSLAAGAASAQEAPHKAGELTSKPLTLALPDGSKLDAEEGWLVVPERRGDVAGRLIEIAFVRVRGAAGGTPTIFLNGGPGQPATPIARSPKALAEWQPYLSIGDLILLDQRGIGASRPSLDYENENRPELPAEFFASLDVARELVLQGQRECREHFERLGVDLAAYNTEASADDVDDLRAALGLEKVNLLGFSYGTLLGLTTMRRHGAHLDRVVLVGTEGPRDWGSLPSTIQAQLEKLSLLASRDAGVNQAVPDFCALLDRVLARLEEKPLEVEVQDRRAGKRVRLLLGRWGLEFLLRIDVGDGNDFPLFPALVWTIDQGRTDVVAPLLEKRYNQLGGAPSAMAQAVRYAYGPTAVFDAQLEAEQGRCLFRSMVNYFDVDARAVWDLPQHDESFRAPIVSDLPVLFVSGTLDSNAPPYQAEVARQGLLQSVHLVLENAGHEDLLPDEQVRAAIVGFLGGKDVRALRLALPPIQFVGIRKR